MTELYFWLEYWEHECCGDRRKVGDEIEVALTFSGVVEPIEDYESVLALDIGEMLVAGEVAAGSDGWVVRSGAVSFGVENRLVSPRVRCQGRLWEIRHETAVTGMTKGRITDIRWRPALMSEDRHVLGYEAGQVIYNTDNRPEKPRPISFGPIRAGLVAPPPWAKGPFVQAVSAPSDADLERHRPWAFVFTIEVSEPSGLVES